METKAFVKLLSTALLLILIDRAEFVYYAFDGNGKEMSFLCCHAPIAQSWWVQIESYYFQLFLFTMILLLWLPYTKAFMWVPITFFLCMPEFALTYGKPVAKIPLPFDWYIPISVSTLRLSAVCWYLYVVVRNWYRWV